MRSSEFLAPNGKYVESATTPATGTVCRTACARETVAVLNQPDIIARITQDGGIPAGNTPQAFAQEIRNETAKWAKVIKAAVIKAE